MTLLIEKKSFLVGGAVRDKLLGLKPSDFDYVVTDSSHEELLACGFKQVGKSFPVYLHPSNGCEYVLLRGADSNSLESDLEARDLTINSMAINSEGLLIDPFGGQADLKNKTLKHTSHAFADDPLRVLRVARFKTTLDGFKIDPSTKKLMAEVAATPAFKALSGERVLGELKKAFLSSSPSQFFECLKECNCLKHLLPKINYNSHTMLVLDKTRSMTEDFDVLLAALVYDQSMEGASTDKLPLVKEFCSRFKFSLYATKLSMYLCENHLKLHNIFDLEPIEIVSILKAGDFRRNPSLIADFVKVCHSDSLVKLNKEEYLQGKFLLECQGETREAKVSELVEGEINEERVDRAYSDIVSVIKNRYKGFQS